MDQALQTELKTLDTRLKQVDSARCNQFVCRTDEHALGLEAQDLIESRLEIYYQLADHQRA